MPPLHDLVDGCARFRTRSSTTTKWSSRDALDFARRATALHFYATKGASLGYCAQIAGMDKEDFIYFLGQNGVSIFHFDDEAEFVEEMNNA